MHRYATIESKFPREFILLQGTGCRWGRCKFCDYHTDTSSDPYPTNAEVLERVTGIYGVLDIINSGSALEFDKQTLAHIQEIVRSKKIHTLWFEAHFMYREQLAAFAQQFAPAQVKFRCGIESFSPTQRQLWNKGIPDWVTAADVARYFAGICLLCCTEDDTQERILTDISTAIEHFEYCSVNVFCNNSTNIKRNDALAAWFSEELYATLLQHPKIEVLLNNTDLGVG